MSMYTTLKINVEVKEELSNSSLENVKEKLKGSCGVHDFTNINSFGIDICVTFNYGLEKMKDVIKEIKQHLSYNTPTLVGEFRTEEIWDYSYMNVYAHKNELFFIAYEPIFGYGFQEEHYTITNLDDFSEMYALDVNDTNERILEQLIKNSYYKIKNKNMNKYVQ